MSLLQPIETAPKDGSKILLAGNSVLDQTTVNVDYNFLMNSFDPCFTKAARSEENIRQRAKSYPFIPPKEWL